MAESVIDVSSVTIFPKFLPCAVYGCITAYDNMDLSLPIYDLYNRDPEDAELIVEGGQALSVIDIEKILHMQQPVMSLSLKVKDTDSNIKDDAFIASGTVHLDIATHNDYEEVKQAVVDGGFGHATVNYIALPCAFLFNIRIILKDYWESVGDGDQQTASEQDSNYLKCSLYGTIVAHYGRTFGCTDNFCIPLLNVPSDRTIPLYFENGSMPCMKIARNYVAVPAYSSLNIKANLWLAGSDMQVVDEEDTIVLWAKDRRGFSYSQPKRFELPKPRQKVFCIIPHNWDEMFSLKPSSRHQKWKARFFGGDYMLEVFSVFIGRHNDHDLSLSGSITLNYMNMKIDIFNRDDSNPDQLLNGRKLLTITWPDSLECWSSDFYMTVKIKDADDRICIEESHVIYMTTYLEDWYYDSQFDRPLCSVLADDNDNGYCAVHYTVFESAASLSLKIVMLCKGGVDVANVRGKIVAWSDKFDYSKDYDKKYYRRVLYDKPNDQIYYPQKTTKSSSLDEDKHGVVELLESCSVAVPLAFSFNICVDLYANSHTRSDPAEHLHKTFSFMYDEKKQTKMKLEIPGGDFELLMQEL